MMDNYLTELVKTAKQLSNDFEVKLKYNEKVESKNDEFVLDSININAAFFPAVWGCLSVEQKLAAIIIAGQWHGIKINHFCFEPKYYYEIFIYNGKNLCLNISSLGNVLIDSVDFLAEILNYPNQKAFFKMRKTLSNKNEITEFDTFEKLQYGINLKISENAENVNDLTKAIYEDQKIFRDLRNSKILAFNFILDYVTEITADEIKDNYNEQLQKLIEENRFVYSVLGSNTMIRDLAFLRVVKHNIFKDETSLLDLALHFKKHFGKDFIELMRTELIEEDLNNKKDIE